MFWKVLLVEVLFVEGQAFYSGLTHSLHCKRHSAGLPFVRYPCNTGRHGVRRTCLLPFKSLTSKSFISMKLFSIDMP